MDEQEIILTHIFEHSIESVLVFRMDGSIIAANQAIKTETGYGAFICEKNITEIYPMALIKKEDEIVCKGEEENSIETVAYCSNQTCYPVILKIIKVKLQKETMGICFAKNITERNKAIRVRKDAVEKLQDATKIKNEFMANVTHELRTPINGMKGLATNLLDTELNIGQKENVEIIIRCCNNMTKIINDLLDFSKIEAGKLTIEQREFNFHKFLDETMAFNIGRINEKGLKLIINIGADIPTLIIGDELRLGQIINNLFSNAIKFTDVGHIAFEVVKTYESKKEIELFFMVIDTGIGIGKDEMDRLFQSFSQVDGSITRRFGGTGLGLSISKQLVERMGGKIHVDSEKGKGSTFSFTARFGLPKQQINIMKEKIEKYPEGRFIYSRKSLNTVLENSEKSFEKLSFEERLIPYCEQNYENEEKSKEIKENLEKLVLCIEMGTWEKAESFAKIIKLLMPKENTELKRSAFRLELDVRKEDYEKAMKQIKQLKRLLLNEENKI